MSHSLYPGWRSMLFIPVHIDKFVAKAHTRGADAYILDLEDSVPLSEKAVAREKIVGAAKQVAVDGAAALVRINLDETMAKLDLEASIDSSVKAIVIPKVENAAQVNSIADMIDQLETSRNIEKGHTLLIAMIESVEALPNLDEIANAHPRLTAVTLGSEDFSASAGMHSIPETLLLPNQMIAYACRRAGITPLGFPGSIADYSDLNDFRSTIKFANQLGFVGAFCIHPKQATVLNEELLPDKESIENAKGLIAAYESGLKEGRGAVEYRGKMIDMPVVISAKELISRFEKISLMSSSHS